MAMWRRTTARWNEHVDQAITAIGIISGQQNGVGVPSQTNVRQVLVFVRPGHHQIPLKIIRWERGERLRSDGMLIQGRVSILSR